MRPKEWSTACPDWESRIVDGRSLIPFGPLFPDEASAALDVFRSLRVADIAGCPSMGEICRSWITDFVATVFGAYDADTGRRLISEFFLLVSKKNFKSGLAAGIMMTALVRNWRESAEFSILSPTIEIANNSFFPARDMVRRDEELADLMLVQEHYRTITNRQTGASLKVVAADSETVGGKKSTGILIDELWLFGKKASAESMLLEATGGLASRPEGFVIYLSTQSDEAPAGVFDQKLRYARGVRDGRIKAKHFLPVIYEFPEALLHEGKPRDPEHWYVTNPNLGASVDEEFLRIKFGEAEEAGEGSVRGFLAKHLNVEIGLALLSDRWAGADYWELQSAGITLEDLLERCEVITAGIDGGGLDDLLALSLIGRERETGHWLHWARAWAARKVLLLRKKEAARLLDFEKDGDLVLVDRIGDDIDQLADIVERVDASGLLDKVGVDPAGIGSIVDALHDRKIDVDADGKPRIVGISQGWKLVGAIKTTERKLAEEALFHGGTPMMAWCVGNAKVEPRGNAILITKQASGSGKIDPLMATFDAVTLMSLNPQPKKPKKHQLFFV